MTTNAANKYPEVLRMHRVLVEPDIWVVEVKTPVVFIVDVQDDGEIIRLVVDTDELLSSKRFAWRCHIAGIPCQPMPQAKWFELVAHLFVDRTDASGQHPLHLPVPPDRSFAKMK